MGGRGVTEPNLSANCEVGKSAGREGNRWRMANSDWRIVFSGGQCCCIAEKFRCLTTSPRTLHLTSHCAISNEKRHLAFRGFGEEGGYIADFNAVPKFIGLDSHDMDSHLARYNFDAQVLAGNLG